MQVLAQFVSKPPKQCFQATCYLNRIRLRIRRLALVPQGLDTGAYRLGLRVQNGLRAEQYVSSQDGWPALSTGDRRFESRGHHGVVQKSIF